VSVRAGRRARVASTCLTFVILAALPAAEVEGELEADAGSAVAVRDEVPVWENYLLNCSGCHGRDGVGVPGTVPDLHTMGRLFEAPGGREYLARVPGVAQAPMSDAALATLLNWLLDEFGGAPPSIPYEAAEVGRLRGEPLRDPLSVRPKISPEH